MDNTILEIKAGPLVLAFSSFHDWKDRAYTIWEEYHLASDEVIIIDARGVVILTLDEDIVYPVHVYRRRPVAAPVQPQS